MNLPKATPFVVTGIIAAGIAIGYGRMSEGSPADPTFEAKIPPVEFLYLDGPRVLKFLSEMEGGEVGDVRRFSREIDSVDAGAGQGPFSVGASSQRESAAESTVTQTESSALGLLMAQLDGGDGAGIEGDPLKLDKPSNLGQIHEGMLVRFATHSLLSPGYIRPYVVIRQSATLSALFPRASHNEADAAKSKAQRRKAESFVHQVGPDPRLTFAVDPPPQAGEEALKILLPMHYRGLTEERSLLEKGRDEYTGGRLVVVGKVVRIFRRPSSVPCREREACVDGVVPEYTDWGTREIWRNPLRQASKYLIDHVSHNCEMPRTEAELGTRKAWERAQGEPLRGRTCFMRKLQRQTELYAPGAVILPIAIYK